MLITSTKQSNEVDSNCSKKLEFHHLGFGRCSQEVITMKAQLLTVRALRNLFPILRRRNGDHNSELFADLNDALGAEGSHYFQRDHNSTYKVSGH